MWTQLDITFCLFRLPNKDAHDNFLFLKEVGLTKNQPILSPCRMLCNLCFSRIVWPEIVASCLVGASQVGTLQVWLVFVCRNRLKIYNDLSKFELEALATGAFAFRACGF